MVAFSPFVIVADDPRPIAPIEQAVPVRMGAIRDGMGKPPDNHFQDRPIRQNVFRPPDDPSLHVGDNANNPACCQARQQYLAVGKCFGATIVPARTDAWINGHQVVAGGARAAFEDAVVRGALGDAKDSPLTQQEFQGYGGVGFAYPL